MPTINQLLELQIFSVRLGRDRFRAGTRIADRAVMGAAAADEAQAVMNLFAALGSSRNDDIQLAIDIALVGGPAAFRLATPETPLAQDDDS